MPTLNANGINIFYELHGHGEPLVLLSGTGNSGEHWKYFQLPEMARHFQVVTWDFRGTGQSDKPDAHYSTRMFADDCFGLMKSLGIDRAHILGHSMGGRVAQWLAIDHPEAVASLILSSTGPGSVEGYPFERGLPFGTCAQMMEQGFDKYMWNFHESQFMFPAEFVRENPAAVSRLRDANLKYPTPARPYLRHMLARQEHETSKLLDKITCPTLVICGAGDVHMSGTFSHVASCEALVNGIKGAEFKTVDGCNHGYLWQKPEVANAIYIEFLNRHRIKKAA
jgi:pimeloyl-ACP methyl ester carboxylesterase